MSDEPKSRFEYQEVSLDAVMRFFANDFKPNSDSDIERITSVEWFVDIAKSKVVFKLFVTPKNYPLSPAGEMLADALIGAGKRARENNP